MEINPMVIRNKGFLLTVSGQNKSLKKIHWKMSTVPDQIFYRETDTPNFFHLVEEPHK